MKTPSPTKLAKAALIAQCTEVIATHCGAPASHIIEQKPRQGTALREARALLVYHLYSCGMSFVSIARLLGRSVDTVRRAESSGAIRMMGSDRKLLETLPRIGVTFSITKSEPVTEAGKGAMIA